MNIKDLTESLPFLFAAQVTPYIHGHAGIGKTSIVKQYANKNNLKFFALYLGTQSDLGDVLGLADFVRDENGTAIATKFATPDWLRDTIDYCEQNPDSGAIIFLDEFNRARRDVLQGMFSLALDKKFHTTQLPTNCHIVAAGNPPTEEYYVTDINDSALMARFAHVKLEPTIQEWVEYAQGSQMEHTLISFIQEQPSLLEDSKSEFDLPVKVDRRSYERLGKLFAVKTPQHLLQQLMYGIIGKERTVAYLEHLKNSERPIDALELLNNKKSLKTIKKWSEGDVKTPLLTITFENVGSHFKLIDDGKAEKLEREQFINLLNALKAAPKDISYPFFVKAKREQNSIELGRWMQEDSEFYKDILKLIKEALGK